MNLKPVQIQFGTEDLQKIIGIALDEDKEQALAFIQFVLVKKVEKALQRHWAPVFEACYGPGQVEHFGQ